MSCLSFFRRATLLGLDIQSDVIRLVQQKKFHKSHLDKRLATILPQTITIEGKIVHWDVLRSHLTAWVQEQSLNGMSVAICLPAQLVRMQRLVLPVGLNEAEIMMEIQLLLQRDLPGLKDALSIDFQVLSQDEKKMAVFFVAIREEYLLQYIECVESTGLHVKIVDVDVWAVLRVIRSVLPLLVTTERYVLICFINTTVMLIGFDSETILFSQCWEWEESENGSVKLNQYLQLHLATYPVSDKVNVFLYGWGKHAITLNYHNIELRHIDPFKEDMENIDNDPLHALPNYLLAYGLSMRQNPPW